LINFIGNTINMLTATLNLKKLDADSIVASVGNFDTLNTPYTCAFYSTNTPLCTVICTKNETTRIVNRGTGDLWTDSCGSAYTTHDSGGIILSQAGGYRITLNVSGYSLATAPDSLIVGMIRKRGEVRTVMKHDKKIYTDKDTKLFDTHLQCIDAAVAANDTIFPFMINLKDNDDIGIQDGTIYIELKEK
jgi:hypothetical protein